MAGIWKIQHNYEGYTTNRLKRKVFNRCIFPAMTYGAETWTLTTKMDNKLSAAKHNMERNTFKNNYKDRNTNNWVRD